MAQQNNQNHKTLRVPPNDLEAERAVLGSIMLRHDAMNDVMEIVSVDSFYSQKHRIIFKGMLELIQKHEPIDLLSLRSKLESGGMLEQIGGAAYLAELVHVVPSASNAEHYSNIVQKKFMMRNLIEASEFISQIGFDESAELDELLDKAEKKIFDVTNIGTKYKFIEIKDILNSAWERLDRIHSTKGELRGVPTGFKELDAKLSGFQNSDLIILAARPSMGKTSLALDVARKAAINHNIPILIFSLEMSADQLIDRLLASEAMVDAWKLRTGKLTAESDFERLRESMDRLSKAPITIDDQPGNNILKMRSIARRLKAENRLGLIIVDYLQLMVPTMSKNSDNVVQQVTEISRSLKNLAREMEVPVIALSQLSREVEKRGGRPRLSDLRDSGSIEQDADVVMFIHREDKYSQESDKTNIAEIMIEKHRNGPTGSAQLYFDGNKSSFVSIEKSDFGDFADHFTE